MYQEEGKIKIQKEAGKGPLKKEKKRSLSDEAQQTNGWKTRWLLANTAINLQVLAYLGQI